MRMHGGGMEVDALILGMIPYQIHGEIYVNVYYAHDDDPETVLQARLPQDAIYHNPKVNDRIRVHYLLKVVTGITKREDARAASSNGSG
jgi:hypothetical protein